MTYLLFRSVTVHGAPNQLLSDGLFGVPLGAHWLSGAGLLSVHDGLFLAVFAVLAALCWLAARLPQRSAPAAAPATATAPVPGPVPVPARRSAAGSRPDAAEALADSKAAGLLTRVLPYVTVVFAAFAPLAAAIYLLTTVAWTLAERGLFVRRTARDAKLAGRKLGLAGSQDGDPE